MFLCVEKLQFSEPTSESMFKGWLIGNKDCPQWSLIDLISTLRYILVMRDTHNGPYLIRFYFMFVRRNIEKSYFLDVRENTVNLKIC